MINGCPRYSIDIGKDIDDQILDIIQLRQLLALVTTKGVYIYNLYNLLPLASHVRSPLSIEENGLNIVVKTKFITELSLKRQSVYNLFIQTNQNFLLIYQIKIDYSQSVYEVLTRDNGLMQLGLPLSVAAQKSSLFNMIRSATKAIINGTEEVSPNLENIESFQNDTNDDDLGGYEVNPVQLSIFKLLKIGSGRQEFWLRPNSHELYVFTYAGTEISQENQDSLQVVDLTTFESKLIELGKLPWYKGNAENMFYNKFFDYFVVQLRGQSQGTEAAAVDDDDDDDDDEYKVVQFRVSDLETYNILGKQRIDSVVFNPRIDFFYALSKETDLNLYKIDKGGASGRVHRNNNHNNHNFSSKMILIRSFHIDTKHLQWSKCGNYIVVLDKQGYWKVISKFGNTLFDTNEIISELDDNKDESRDFLCAKRVLYADDGNGIYVLSIKEESQKKLYYIPLLNITKPNDIIYDQSYITLVDESRNLIKFPILSKFKKLIQQRSLAAPILSYANTEQLSLSKNEINNQLAISYGEHLAVSTPFKTSEYINHILWFNFKNLHVEPMNIIHQVWFKDYLIVVNRRERHFLDENDIKEEDNHFIDELIVFDTSRTKYGMSGEDVTINSENVLWKYDFKTTFIDFQMVKDEAESHLVILTYDYKIVVLDLFSDKMVEVESQSKYYKIFISINRTIHLQSLQDKINLKDVVQSSMIHKRHFLFLLNSGELYLLKNLGRQSSFVDKPIDAIKPSNMYDLIQFNTMIEFFKFKQIQFLELIQYIYMFDGQQTLIYDVDELVDKAHSNFHKQNGKEAKEEEGELEDLDSSLLPVVIESEGLQPIDIEASSERSINLIGLEKFVVNGHSPHSLVLKQKVAHKLILNNFIEFDLVHRGDLQSTYDKYKSFKNFQFCLELLLFKHLTDDLLSLPLKRLCQLIEFSDNAESIYINCLRKIEIGYWGKFFDVINASPEKFMNRLIKLDDVELCYNYLIVYLNYKREGEVYGEAYGEASGDKEDNDKKIEADEKLQTDRTERSGAEGLASDQLNRYDKQIILEIVKMLEKAGKWDWCFDLCRFLKILEPSGQFLKQVKSHLNGY